MIKNLLFVAVLAFTLVACNNTADQAGAVSGDEVAFMTVDELELNIENLVDSQVVVAGDVDHVCKHGGTKMVIIGDSASIHIKSTEESGNFRADEVMDHRVIVTGIVSEFRVDEGYIAEKEAELEEALAKGGELEEGDADCEEEKGDSDCEEEGHEEKGNFPDNDNKHKKKIDGMKKQIEGLKAMLEEVRAEGKDHVSFYSVEAASYVIDEDADVESEGKAYEDTPAEMAEEAEEAHDHDHDGDHEGHDHE